MTNADKIRNMGNNELANVIMCPYDIEVETCKDSESCLDCSDCCLEWLNAKIVD